MILCTCRDQYAFYVAKLACTTKIASSYIGYNFSLNFQKYLSSISTGFGPTCSGVKESNSGKKLVTVHELRKILTLRLFDEEKMNTVYGITETDANKTLHAKNVGCDNLKDHKQDNEYIKNWKAKMKCNSCGEVGH